MIVYQRHLIRIEDFLSAHVPEHLDRQRYCYVRSEYHVELCHDHFTGFDPVTSGMSRHYFFCKCHIFIIYVQSNVSFDCCRKVSDEMSDTIFSVAQASLPVTVDL